MSINRHRLDRFKLCNSSMQTIAHPFHFVTFLHLPHQEWFLTWPLSEDESSVYSLPCSTSWRNSWIVILIIWGTELGSQDDTIIKRRLIQLTYPSQILICLKIFRKNYVIKNLAISKVFFCNYYLVVDRFERHNNFGKIYCHQSRYRFSPVTWQWEVPLYVLKCDLSDLRFNGEKS